MSQVLAITKREFNSYFKSAMGWVLFAIYAFVSGLYFSSMLMSNYIDISQILQFVRSLFFVLIPIMTMRSFSEDKKNGTEVLLATSPANTLQIVLGKYFGTVLMFLFVSSINIIYLIVTLALQGTVDIKYLGAVIAYLLTAFTYLAIGIFASSLTENQIIAAVISFVIFASFEILGALSSIFGTLVTSMFNQVDFMNLIPAGFDAKAGEAVTAAINWLNPANRLAGFTRGIFDLLTIVYFLSMIVVFLYITMQVVERRRWSQ